ncbi:hypothetical protein LJK88_46335 [Paenibacillus sp. P26]|nr:hypothetical protein LJK88_46335 [Paenibacillus sp. P26]
MIHFILLLILCIIGGVCLPVLRRTLHPVEILVCWILTATLEQFDHAVLIVNLGVVEISGKIPDFFTLKLEQLAAFVNRIIRTRCLYGRNGFVPP